MALTQADRARGAYPTPPSLARILAEFALRDPADRLLDPGCGAGGLLAAGAAALGAQVTIGDFLDLAPGPPVDAVIGNPPFLGYHRFRRGAPGLNGFASAWAAFTLRTLDWLKPTGRLALVLPAELMAAGYAAPRRRLA